MVKETETKTFVEELYCDKCGTEMEQRGEVYLTDPPQYPYRCPKCGYEVIMSILYPRTVVKPIS